MKMILKDTENQMEYVMPIMPSEYGVGRGMTMETIHIHASGDVALAGNPSLETISVNLLLPAQIYPYCQVSPLAPYDYIDFFRRSCLNKSVLRFIVTGTPVNVGVRIERLEYGENDGSRDVRARLTFREHRELSVISTLRPEETPVREEEDLQGDIQTHVIVYGDTLWHICRKYYGEPTLYPKVAAYNNVANPNWIPLGTELKIPPKSML